MTPLSREDEIKNLKRIYQTENCRQELYKHLSNIFNILHQRIVVVLTLCGAIVSVTGFSGRRIAQTHISSQILVILGLLMCLSAAAVCVFRVLPVYWLSRLDSTDLDHWLMTVLEYRDKKTRAYRFALVLLLLGMTFYLSAVIIMLMHPNWSPPGRDEDVPINPYTGQPIKKPDAPEPAPTPSPASSQGELKLQSSQQWFIHNNTSCVDLS